MVSRVVVALAALVGSTVALIAPAAAPRHATRASALGARTSIIGGNWKMNPTSLEDAKALATEITAAVADAPGEHRGGAAAFLPWPGLDARRGDGRLPLPSRPC